MLNQAQLQAVQTTEGAVRILAGPGTGKTRTICERIGYLIEVKKVVAERILVLTFSHKAAHEVKQRLGLRGAQAVAVRTFHSLAAEALRRFQNPDLKILDDKVQREILTGIMKEKELKYFEEIRAGIDNLKEEEVLGGEKMLAEGHILEGKEVLNKKNDDLVEHCTKVEEREIFEEGKNLVKFISAERLREIFAKYQQALEESTAYDFTALLVEFLKLLKNDAAAGKFFQRNFNYLMIDEYQDANRLQIEMMKLLGAAHGNVCVVGDPDQTIYSWRGSEAQSMADFLKIYPEAKSIILTENYRNPPQVLRAAESLIVHNRERIEKSIRALKPESKPVFFWQSSHQFEQYEMVASLLEEYLGSHNWMHQADNLDRRDVSLLRAFDDISMLFRTQSEMRRMENFLFQKGYPYNLAVKDGFWGQEEVQTFLKELNLLAEIGQFSEQQLFSDWLRERICDFTLRRRLGEAKEQLLHSLLAYAMDLDSKNLQEALREFIDLAKTTDESDSEISAAKINLLTLHAAKGLEFPIVMLFGLEEGTLPHKKSASDEEAIAEERRLLFTGMTRTSEELHLFCNVKSGQRVREKSRFLAEIGLEKLRSRTLVTKRQIKIRKKVMLEAQTKIM